MTTPTVTRRYLIVWGWLLLLMALSLLTGWLPLHRGTIVTVMLALAVGKAALVALHFMHLRVEARLVHALVVVPALLVLGLLAALVPDFVLR